MITRNWKLRLGLLLAALCALAGCGANAGAHSGTASTNNGWSIYQDQSLPFQIAMPPGWRAGAFVDGIIDYPNCEHVVDFFPPGSNAKPETAAEGGPELIYIIVHLDCPDWGGTADDQYAKPESKPLLIDRQQATIYDIDTTDLTQRSAVVKFGGHQYQLNFTYNANLGGNSAAKGQRELALYLRMIQTFKYTG